MKRAASGGAGGQKTMLGLVAAVLSALAVTSQLGCVHVLGDFDLASQTDSGSTITLVPDGAPADQGPIVDAGPTPPTRSCAVGEKQCQGSVLFGCHAKDVWTFDVDCPALCTSGECVGMCKPGTKDCQGMSSRTCKADGTWDPTLVSCSFGCFAGNCGICTSGATRCAGTAAQPIQQTCDVSGNWKDTMPCPFVCTSNACSGVCVPGSKQCAGNRPETCTPDGQWVDDATACPALCVGQGVCSDRCATTDVQCNGRTQETCPNGTAWVDAATPCANGCQKGACTVCSPGAKQCSGDNSLQTCDANGQWNTALCPYICVNAACGGACTPGTFRCSTTNNREQCMSNATWGPSQTCSFPCDANTATCGVCNPGDKRCSGTKTQVCTSSAQFQDTAVCANGCAAGVCL